MNEDKFSDDNYLFVNDDIEGSKFMMQMVRVQVTGMPSYCEPSSHMDVKFIKLRKNVKVLFTATVFSLSPAPY